MNSLNTIREAGTGFSVMCFAVGRRLYITLVIVSRTKDWVEKLQELAPDVAMLPVNGRRRELVEKKIAGNFSLAEAIEICLKAGIPTMIAQHFGLFALVCFQYD